MRDPLTARRLVTATEVVDFPVITLAEDGTIARIDIDPKLGHEDDTLCAASLDVHIHGSVGKDVMSAAPAEFSELQRFLAQHGVANYLPTTVTADIETTLRSLERIATQVEAREAKGEARAIGIHLEGPFLSHAKRGVHPAEELQPPTPELFSRFWQAARGHIKLLTLAPELPGALDFIPHVRSFGVRVSLGHSNATFAEATAAIEAGASSATHTFNAMRALSHREPGIAAAVLKDERLFAEIIADGVHVAPEMVELWWRSKGQRRALLVTDAMPAAGMPAGPYTLGGLPVTVAEGKAVLTNAPETLAGSLLTLDCAVANLQHFTGASLNEAVAAASHNPAAMLGLESLTALSPGSFADLNRYNSDGRLVATYLRGELVR